MIVESIRASELSIPFKATFKHASAERSTTQSLWVEAKSIDGVCGYGEGCPREYVSDETLAGSIAFVQRGAATWCEEIRDVASLTEWVARHRLDIDRNPAAWTAVELALLDLIGKTESKSVENLLGLSELDGTFQYSAIIGDSSPAQFEAQLAAYVGAGFSDFKIKLAGDAIRDRAKTRSLKAAGIPSDRVRADANNLWTDAASAIRDLAALDFSFHAVEEPLQAGDYEGLQRLSVEINAKVVLDESLLRRDQLAQLGKLSERSIVNLRISKMGGLLRSCELVDELRVMGLPIIVGAHVGETSMLTRAALAVAHNARDLLKAQEGAFGTHLLATDVVDSPIMFGAGGILRAEAVGSIGHAGFGLRYRTDADFGK